MYGVLKKAEGLVQKMSMENVVVSETSRVFLNSFWGYLYVLVIILPISAVWVGVLWYILKDLNGEMGNTGCKTHDKIKTRHLVIPFVVLTALLSVTIMLPFHWTYGEVISCDKGNPIEQKNVESVQVRYPEYLVFTINEEGVLESKSLLDTQVQLTLTEDGKEGTYTKSQCTRNREIHYGILTDKQYTYTSTITDAEMCDLDNPKRNCVVPNQYELNVPRSKVLGLNQAR